jgi:hypothetical protein
MFTGNQFQSATLMSPINRSYSLASCTTTAKVVISDSTLPLPVCQRSGTDLIINNLNLPTRHAKYVASIRFSAALTEFT